MAHKCGFTYRALEGSLQEAGFIYRAGLRRPKAFDLWMIAFKKGRGESELLEIAARFIP